MKIASLVLALSALSLSLYAPQSVTAHECKVVCDAAHPSPVCGNDGTTYASECALLFAQCEAPSLKVAHKAACTTADKKAAAKKPVVHISVNAKKGAIEKRDITDQDDDEEDEDEEEEEDDEEDEEDEEEADHCQKGCTRELDMLCASDHVTYNNHCLFEIALCRNPKLKIVDPNGPCKCEKDCTRELDMLCASDGKTYNNQCLFNNAKCTNSSLTITNPNGPCPQK